MLDYLSRWLSYSFSSRNKFVLGRDFWRIVSISVWFCSFIFFVNDWPWLPGANFNDNLALIAFLPHAWESI